MMDTSFNVRRGERIDSEYAAPGYEQLPEDLQEEGVSKSFYQGYEVVVRAIATVICRVRTEQACRWSLT